jgi:hypothetical protein
MKKLNRLMCQHNLWHNDVFDLGKVIIRVIFIVFHGFLLVPGERAYADMTHTHNNDVHDEISPRDY